MFNKLSVSLCRDRLRGPGGRWAALFVVGLAICLALTAATDGRRTAAAAALAAGVLLLTRIRFARVAALVLVALIALVAVGGAAPGQDMRSVGGASHHSARRHGPSAARPGNGRGAAPRHRDG